MFEMKIWVKIDPNKQLEFEQAINSLIDRTYFKSIDCSCDLVQPIKDRLKYCYSEKWHSKEAFELHKVSSDFRALLGAMKVLGEIIASKLLYYDKEENIMFN